MNDQMRRRAAMLLIELESLKECQVATNTIGTFVLLEEVLKDAGALATQALQPDPAVTLEARANAALAANRLAREKIALASARSAAVMEKARAALARSFQRLALGKRENRCA